MILFNDHPQIKNQKRKFEEILSVLLGDVYESWSPTCNKTSLKCTYRIKGKDIVGERYLFMHVSVVPFYNHHHINIQFRNISSESKMKEYSKVLRERFKDKTHSHMMEKTSKSSSIINFEIKFNITDSGTDRLELFKVYSEAILDIHKQLGA